MEFPIVPTALIVVIVGGSLIQLIWGRDDWPLSNYSMYAHLVVDRENNPFVPLKKEHDGAAGFLVLALEMTNGSSMPLTTRYAHPLLMPFERLRILRHLTTLYKRGDDLSAPMKNLADWVSHRMRETGAREPVRALVLELYLWRRIPQSPEQHHPPDQVIRVAAAELA